MRDAGFTLLMLMLMPVCFRRPLIGMLTFTWLAYMRAQDLTWGFAKNQRWSFLIAIIMGAGWLISRERRGVTWNSRTVAMVALVGAVGVSLFFSVPTPESMASRYIEFAKIVGIALFTTALLYRLPHLRMMVWVIALSFAFYGVKNGLTGILNGGKPILQGPGGMLEDNNDFALALCMGLPMLIQIGASERNRVLRRGVYAMVPLCLLAVLLTHSRGGFLALTAMTLMLIWRSRNRMAAFGVLAVAGIVALPFIPESFIERISTLTDYQSDGSAMGRLAAWQTAINMALDNPVWGVGLAKFQAAYPDYASGLAHETARVTHNAYLQIWAECGSIALGLYLFLIASTFWSLARVRAQAKRLYTSSWILNYAAMFEASMLAFVVGSAFLNRAHFDLFYHMVAIVICFETIAVAEMRGVRERAPVGQRGSSFRLVLPGGYRRAPVRPGFRNGGAGQPA
jgi:probable O-glycosylation ligase (exosortase A-associated)